MTFGASSTITSYSSRNAPPPTSMNHKNSCPDLSDNNFWGNAVLGKEKQMNLEMIYLFTVKIRIDCFDVFLTFEVTQDRLEKDILDLKNPISLA